VKPVDTACTDDENVCTRDICDGSGKTCTHPAGNAGTVCRAIAGDCDVAEECDGTSPSCPTDEFKPSSVECRATSGECDVAESCSGSGASCPADAVKTGDIPCGDDGNVCTRDVCDGSAKSCTHPAGNAGTVCRTIAGDCDVAEECDGTSPSCPTDAFKPSSVECRATSGECDLAESCTGSGASCPADAVKPVDTACGDDENVCTRDVCDGSGKTCTHPAGNAGTVCRAAAGECDMAEVCTGSSPSCPANGFRPLGATCGDDGNVCTDDQCDGSGACMHPNNTAPCSDGNACTAPDVCAGGTCVSGPAVYGFTGFFPPVNNPNTLNVGKAGRTFPLKFQLPLCSGGFVSSLGAVTDITYRRIACDNFLPQDALPTDADTSGGSGLHYDSDANQYVFNWQTSSTFVSKCYELRLDFGNGSYKTALFKFTK
jgi:hypothetical protein